MSSAPQPPAAPPPPPPTRDGRAVVLPWTLAGVLAVAVVVLVVLLATGKEEEVGSTAESSARATCEVLGQIPDDVDTDDEKGLALLQFRLASAVSLAMLAEEQDGTFADLSEAVNRMRAVFASEFSTDVPEFGEAREDAEDECADLG